MPEVLIAGATVATMAPGDSAYGLLPDAGIAIRDGRIAGVGAVEAMARLVPGAAVRDVAGRLVTPALIDCHTHVVHAGDRAREFEMRLEGAAYEAIARVARTVDMMPPPARAMAS